MSYIPTEWFTGDVITAEKLNKIEDGIAGIETNIQTDLEEVQGSVANITDTVEELECGFDKIDKVLFPLPSGPLDNSNIAFKVYDAHSTKVKWMYTSEVASELATYIGPELRPTIEEIVNLIVKSSDE